VLVISISCAWVLGILAGSLADFPLALIFTGVLPLPILFFSKIKKNLVILFSCCLFSFFGAAFYYPASLPGYSSVSVFNNQDMVELKGNVIAEPEVKDNITHLQISVIQIKAASEWQDTRGKVLLYVPRYPEYFYGDSLRIKGKLEDPPKFADFDYQAYLAREGIYSTMRFAQIEILERGTGWGPTAWIYSIRTRLSQSLAQSLPEPQASLAQGIILGIRTTIPDSLRSNLSITGTAHLLAISGMNLTIVTGILVSLGLWIFGRRHYFYIWITLAAIWIYALITGMEAPVVRSSIMATIFLLAELTGRQKSSFVALTLSAAVMVGVNPQVLWTISFQLSYLSMVGLIFIAPYLQNLGHRTVQAFLKEEGPARIVLPVIDSFSVALASTVAVWPLVAYKFGLISYIGPLATVLITPVFSAIIFGGMATAVIGIMSPSTGQVIGWVAWLFISYMLWLVNAFANLPAASIKNDSISIGLVWTYYAIFIMVIYIMSNLRKITRVILRIIEQSKSGLHRAFELYSALPKKYLIIPLLILALLTSLAAVSLPDKYLHVSFLNVGEGDASLIHNGNQNILIDGGPSSQAICLGLSQKLPFWDRSLDLVILTHPHLDHLSGLIEVLKRYKVKQILAPDLAYDSPFYTEWERLIEQKHITHIMARADQSITLGNGVIINVLSPPEDGSSDAVDDIDEDGLVLRLTKDHISFLFTADIGQETEQRLVRQRAELFCTVLKVGHHGSSGSTCKDFLTQAGPQAAVISVGADNSFGHPDEQVLNRLKENLGSDDNIYRTDVDGTIEFITDGKTLRVKTDH
jgi:competence protein ComEC